MNNIIETLDLTDFKAGGETKINFVNNLKRIFETTGFFFLKNHGISQHSFSEARSACEAFFNLQDDIKRKYEFAEEQHQRGYTPLRIEKGEFANIADEKQFFQFGNDRNVDVKEIEDFKYICSRLFNEFREESLYLLRAAALSLNLAENYFDQKEGNSIMRAIDYPPTENPLVDDGEAARGGNIIGMCASKHTDINILTLLEAKEEGLQLWYNGTWLPVTINDPEVIIVNSGDMLEHLTGGRYRSGLHRVVCRKNVRRFSIPYFCHLSMNESVVPLTHLGYSDLDKYRFETAGEYLDYRLKQIGL